MEKSTHKILNGIRLKREISSRVGGAVEDDKK